MKYEVTASIVVEAESAQDATHLFDEDYRDTLTVVHLRASLVPDWSGRAVQGSGAVEGQRRNGFTAVQA